MSTTIDNKIVEMSFNNSDFEKNAKQTIETTEKLKKSLNFEGAAKGLNQISEVSKNNNLGVLSAAVEGVSNSFSAMRSIATFALYDIYNVAKRTASQLVDMFAIQPVTQGFAEYELQMGAIQTIQASTGESVAKINSYLDELNHYADETIYSFSDMTQNIGKFTNSGVDLERAVKAIQGISNEAAVSGANTNEASRAMYNFAQALSAGYVKLIDWKSIENANMATVEFKQQLIDTAESMNILRKQADGTYKVLTKSSTGSEMEDTISATKNFNDSLQYQWMTSEVLIKTLGDYADETTAIGKKAFAAATEVKTFSMMMDTLTESAGSGWTTTWQTIVGDFDEAKEFWTELTNMFDDIISASSDARIAMVTDVFGSAFDQFSKTCSSAGVSLDDFQNRLKEVGVPVDDLVNRYGSLQKAFDEGAISSDKINEALSGMTVTLHDNVTGADEEMSALDALARKAVDSGHTIDDIINRMGNTNGRNLLTDTIFKIVDGLRIISSAFHDAEGVITSSGIYGALQKLNDAATYFHDVIERNFQSPFEQFSQVLEKAGGDISTFENSLKKVGVPVDDLKVKYGSLQKAFDDGAVSTDNVNSALENMNSQVAEQQAQTEELTKTLEYFQTVVDKVWNGDYKNGKERVEALTKAGYNYQEVQDLVNKTVDGHRLTLDDLSEEQARNIGFTEEQITTLEQLQKAAQESGTSLDDLVQKMGKRSVRATFVDTINKLLGTCKTLAGAVATAWNNAFGSMRKSIAGSGLQTAIEWINKKANALSDWAAKNAPRITRLFTGLFSVLRSIGNLVKTTLTSAFKMLSRVFDSLDIDINLIDPLADFGDVLVAVAKTIDEFAEKIPEFFDNFEKIIEDLITQFGEFIKNFEDLPIVKDIVENASSAFGDFSESFKQMLSDVASGKVSLIDIISDLGREVVSALTNAASYVQENGMSAFLNLFKVTGDGVKGGLKEISKSAEGPASQISELFSSLFKGLGEFAKSTAPIVVSIGVLKNISDVIKTMANALDTLAAPFAAFESVAKSAAGFMGKLGTAVDKLAKSFSFAITTEAFINLGIAVALFAASIAVIWTLAKTDGDALQFTIGVMAGIVAVLYAFLQQASMLPVGASKNLEALGKAFTELGVAVILVAAAAKIIGSIDNGNLLGVAAILGVITLVLGALGGLTIAAAKCLTAEDTAVIYAMGYLFNTIGKTFLLIGVALKLVSTIDEASMTRATVIFGLTALLLGALVGLVIALPETKTYAMSTALNAIGNMFKSVGEAFIMIAVAIAILGHLEPSVIGKGILSIAMIGNLIAALMLVTALASRIAGAEAGGMSGLLSVTASIGLMAIIAYLCGKLDPATMERGKEFVIQFGVLATAMYGAIKAINRFTKGGESGGALGALLGMSLAIAIMAAVAVLLGYCDPMIVERGILFVAQFAALASMMALAAKGSFDKQTMTNILALSAAIAVMAVVAIALSMLDPAKLQPAVIALGLMTVCFAALIAATSLLGGKKISVVPILEMAAVVAGIGFLIQYLSNMTNPAGAVGIAVGMSVFLIALAAAVKILSSIENWNLPEGINGELLVLGVIMAGLGALIAIISNIPMNIPNAIAITILAGAMMIELTYIVGLLTSLNGKRVPWGVVGQMAVLATIMSGLAALIAVISMIPGDMDRARVLTHLAGLMIAELSILTIALTIFAGDAIDGSVLGTIVLLGGIMAALGLVVALLAGGDWDIPKALAITISMSTLILALSAAAVILMSAHGTAASGIAGVETLAVLVAALIALCVILGGLDEALGGLLGSWLESGLDLLVTIFRKFGEALGALFGGIVGGFQAAQMITYATSLGTAVQILAFNFSNVNSSMFDNIKKFVEAMTSLAGANIAQSLSNVLGGSGDQVIKMAGQLGMALTTFMLTTLGMNPEKVKPAAEAAAALATALANVPNSGGLLEGILGGKDYGKFAEGVKSIGKALRNFVISAGGVSTETVQPAADAISTLISTLSNLPETGGWLQDIMGTKDYGKFAENLSALGDALPAFVNATGQINVDTVRNASDALAYIIEKMQNLPTEGGWLKNLTGGTMSMGEFAGNLGTLGGALYDFSEAVKDVNFGKVQNATNKLGDLIEKLRGINESGINQGSINGLKEAVDGLAHLDLRGMVENFESNGDTDFNAIGSEMMSRLADGINSGITSVHSALNNILLDITFTVQNNSTGLSQIGVQMVNNIAQGMNSNSDGLPSVVRGMMTTAATVFSDSYMTFYTAGVNLAMWFSNGIKSQNIGSDTFSAALNNISTNIASYNMTFYSAGANLVIYLGQGIQAGGSSATSYLASLVYTMTATITSMGLQFQNAGATCTSLLAIGMTSHSAVASTAAILIMTVTTTAIRAYNGQFRSLGTSLIQAFANGITSAAHYIPSAATSAMGSALSALRSYRSEFYQAGAYCAQGFANGLSDSSWRASVAARALAGAAVDAANKRLDEHSPSRVFMQSGIYAGEGLAIGLYKMFGSVRKMGAGLADSVVDGYESVKTPDLMSISTSIVPTVNTQNIKHLTTGLNLTPTIEKLVSDPVKSSVHLMSELESKFNASNDRIASEISYMRGDLSEYAKTIEGTENAIYVDGKKLASSIAKPMNKELGTIARRSGL